VDRELQLIQALRSPLGLGPGIVAVVELLDLRAEFHEIGAVGSAEAGYSYGDVLVVGNIRVRRAQELVAPRIGLRVAHSLPGKPEERGQAHAACGPAQNPKEARSDLSWIRHYQRTPGLTCLRSCCIAPAIRDSTSRGCPSVDRSSTSPLLLSC